MASGETAEVTTTTPPVDVMEVIPTSVEEVSQLWLTVQDLGTDWGIKALAALAILIIGRWVAKGIRRGVRRMMEKGGVDPIIIGFVGSITYIALLAFVIIAALGQLGIQTTSFIAILGAAGLAVGLALQGSLANFAIWEEERGASTSLTAPPAPPASVIGATNERTNASDLHSASWRA